LVQVLKEQTATGTQRTSTSSPTRTFTLGQDVIAQADGSGDVDARAPASVARRVPSALVLAVGRG
jgi:hypothetical protein